MSHGVNVALWAAVKELCSMRGGLPLVANTESVAESSFKHCMLSLYNSCADFPHNLPV